MNGQLHTCRYCGRSGTAITADSLFCYIYDRVRENVADEGGLSQFEYSMIYEGGGDDIAVQALTSSCRSGSTWAMNLTSMISLLACRWSS
ncbi:MAG: hypothetical protein I8H71_02090 [Xanthomonadaceae bacterium]|nr:hypothetical protein [Xanthomonadaceae bacterium]